MRAVERRDYYRLDDSIAVDYLIVSQDSLVGDPADVFELPPGFNLMRDLFKMELEAREVIRQVTQEDRTLGSFLHNLNNRIELLASIVTSANDPRRHAFLECNISQGGISFPTTELIAPDSFLAVKLMFHGRQLALTSFAHARYSMLEADAYRSGVQFLSMHPTSEELIARYIVHRQAEERRERLLHAHFDT